MSMDMSAAFISMATHGLPAVRVVHQSSGIFYDERSTGQTGAAKQSCQTGASKQTLPNKSCRLSVVFTGALARVLK
jgi:hypothetical protein